MMCSEITFDDVLDFITTEASHDEIDEIWEAIKDEVQPDDNLIQEFVRNTSTTTQQRISDSLSAYHPSVDHGDAENYFYFDATTNEKEMMLYALADELNITIYDDDEGIKFSVATVDDHFKIEAFKIAYKELSSEEIEKRLKTKN